VKGSHVEAMYFDRCGRLRPVLGWSAASVRRFPSRPVGEGSHRRDVSGCRGSGRHTGHGDGHTRHSRLASVA
jgi:hypothetical protein